MTDGFPLPTSQEVNAAAILDHLTGDEKVTFLCSRVEFLEERVAELTTEIRKMLEHQQFLTNMATEIGAQFSQALSGGALGAISKMMGLGGKRNG